MSVVKNEEIVPAHIVECDSVRPEQYDNLVMMDYLVARVVIAV